MADKNTPEFWEGLAELIQAADQAGVEVPEAVRTRSDDVQRHLEMYYTLVDIAAARFKRELHIT